MFFKIYLHCTDTKPNASRLVLTPSCIGRIGLPSTEDECSQLEPVVQPIPAYARPLDVSLTDEVEYAPSRCTTIPDNLCHTSNLQSAVSFPFSPHHKPTFPVYFAVLNVASRPVIHAPFTLYDPPSAAFYMRTKFTSVISSPYSCFQKGRHTFLLFLAV